MCQHHPSPADELQLVKSLLSASIALSATALALTACNTGESEPLTIAHVTTAKEFPTTRNTTAAPATSSSNSPRP